jgi:hypothetical protein
MEELLEELVKNYNCIDNYFTSVKCVLDSNRVAEFKSAVTNKDLCANFAKFLNEYHYVLFPCQKFTDYKSFIDGVLGEFVKWHQSEESDEYEEDHPYNQLACSYCDYTLFIDMDNKTFVLNGEHIL